MCGGYRRLRVGDYRVLDEVEADVVAVVRAEKVRQRPAPQLLPEPDRQDPGLFGAPPRTAATRLT